jgi:hypothetical protein
MIKGTSAQTEYAGALCRRLDQIRPFLVFSEAVYHDRGPIRKDSLDPEFAPCCVDVVSQSAEIHVRALLDAGNRTLRHVQHLRHIGLCEQFRAAHIFQRHTL